jgi:serine/tyrosine/threonine adenylyltransferase
MPSPLPDAGWHLEHSYASLPRIFHEPSRPDPVRRPAIAVFNHSLAASLGLDAAILDSPEGAAIFSGNTLPPGSRPLAQAYAGHQFGHFTSLGDGRAILLGEQIDPDGRRWDVQLKGSGPTRFSRRGDGRAALGPMLREFLISEAMHALGIPTTRSLAVTLTGESVRRESLLPGAVLTRIAASHIRVGTFEWAAASGDLDAAAALVNYTLARHFPDSPIPDSPALALLNAVAARQASLIAQWQLVGFIHGVMNTDNMALSGETIDYGPCAFMDHYDPATVFSSIDHHGRYAYHNQPPIAHWNLTRFAEALLPLIHPDESAAIALAQTTLKNFPDACARHLFDGLKAKLGLVSELPGDRALVDDFLTWMHSSHADFTNSFAALSNGHLPENTDNDTVFQSWHQRWLLRLAAQPLPIADALALMRQHNPAVIPRNHKVEAALAAATAGDLTPFHQLLAILTNPFAHGSIPHEFSQPAPANCSYQTFCGT